MREEWLLKHFTKENSDLLSSVKCNYCKKIFLSQNSTRDLVFHLCNKHNIIELDEHPERDSVQKHYKIIRKQMMAMCNHCKKEKKNKINFAIYGVQELILHLKVLHPDKYNLNETKTSSSVSTHPKNI